MTACSVFFFFFFCLVICSFPVTLHPPFTYPHTHTHTCVGCVGPYNTVNFWPLSFRLTGQWSARAYACATDHLQETDWHPQWLPTLWTPLGERGLSGWEALRLCVSACVCVCTLRLLWCGVFFFSFYLLYSKRKCKKVTQSLEPLLKKI